MGIVTGPAFDTFSFGIRFEPPTDLGLMMYRLPTGKKSPVVFTPVRLPIDKIFHMGIDIALFLQGT
jgi:hypothetical protein